jgi:hypothetical protein
VPVQGDCRIRKINIQSKLRQGEKGTKGAFSKWKEVLSPVVPKKCKAPDLPLTVSGCVCKDGAQGNGKIFTTPLRTSDEQHDHKLHRQDWASHG